MVYLFLDEYYETRLLVKFKIQVTKFSTQCEIFTIVNGRQSEGGEQIPEGAEQIPDVSSLVAQAIPRRKYKNRRKLGTRNDIFDLAI